MRPTKLNDKFIQAASQVINDDINTIIFTDAELFEEINDLLDPKDKITYRTFQNYKAKADNETLTSFFVLIKKAERKQKKILISELRKTDKNWQRFAWILERKFPEQYNLKQEHNHTIEPITINFNFGVQKKELSKSTQKLILNN